MATKAKAKTQRSALVKDALKAAEGFSVKSIAKELEISTAAIYAWKAVRRTPDLLNSTNLTRVLVLRSRKVVEAMHFLNKDLQREVDQLGAKLEL